MHGHKFIHEYGVSFPTYDALYCSLQWADFRGPYNNFLNTDGYFSDNTGKISFMFTKTVCF